MVAAKRSRNTCIASVLTYGMTSAKAVPDAGLVLEEEADALVFMRTLYFSEQRWGSF